MKTEWVIVAALSLGVVGTQQLSADSIINGFGLLDPALHITFDEFVVPPNTPITDQYSSLDVLFSDTPPLEYDNQGNADFIEGIDGHYLGKSGGGVFSIFFEVNQTEAAFGYATNTTVSTFTALLLGEVVESFQLATTFDDPTQSYIGFTNSLFDEVRFDTGGGGVGVVMDNLQMGTIPGPGVIALLGLAGLATCRRRRN